jgi:hypothetical protein
MLIPYSVNFLYTQGGQICTFLEKGKRNFDRGYYNKQKTGGYPVLGAFDIEFPYAHDFSIEEREMQEEDSP